MKLFVFLSALITVFICLALFFIFLPRQKIELECKTDFDCVPASCCHSSECASTLNKPDCSEIVCTAECVPGTLDCNQGNCACIENECKVKWANVTKVTKK
jgi:hypothetical protein